MITSWRPPAGRQRGQDENGLGAGPSRHPRVVPGGAGWGTSDLALSRPQPDTELGVGLPKSKAPSLHFRYCSPPGSFLQVLGAGRPSSQFRMPSLCPREPGNHLAERRRSPALSCGRYAAAGAPFPPQTRTPPCTSRDHVASLGPLSLPVGTLQDFRVSCWAQGSLFRVVTRGGDAGGSSEKRGARL